MAAPVLVGRRAVMGVWLGGLRMNVKLGAPDGFFRVHYVGCLRKCSWDLA